MVLRKNTAFKMKVNIFYYVLIIFVAFEHIDAKSGCEIDVEFCLNNYLERFNSSSMSYDLVRLFDTAENKIDCVRRISTNIDVIGTRKAIYDCKYVLNKKLLPGDRELECIQRKLCP